MDKCSSDAEFDSYWEYEAKNKNRNRIRVGRQYQATIPPLLKPGDKDGRRFEDLETLKWKPDQLNSSEVERYFSMARAISSFSRAVSRCQDLEETDESSFQAAVKELSEFVKSHHPCHQDAGCEVPLSIRHRAECSSSGRSTPSCNSPGSSELSESEAHIFSQAVEACGKNFCAIKKDYLPWKPVRSLIQYYYSYGKPEKSDTPPPSLPQPSKVPSPFNIKVEKKEEDEPFPSCSRKPDDPQEAECQKTKEDPVAEEQMQEEEVKEEEETEAEVNDDSKVPTTTTIIATSAMVSDDVDEDIPVSLEDDCDDIKTVNVAELSQETAGPSQTTVGSLKFFLGGRLVLKLNAQQGNFSGTRCQWVQSNDTPRHPLRKLKPKKPKVLPDTNRQGVTDSPTPKKKTEEDSNTTPSDGSPAAKKARTQPFGSELDFPPLCSSSWTPPVADGQEPVELDDASSKTSEGCVSPVVFGPRGIKSEVRTDTPVDHKQHLDVQDSRHARLKMESLPVACNSHSDSLCTENYLMQNSGRMLENASPKSLPDDSTCSHEVLNHKSALSHTKSFYMKAPRSGSPSAKILNKRPSPCTDLSERARSSLGFQSPTMMATEIPVRENVLDLSSRTDQCKSREANSSYQTHTHISPTRCIENCSSSEGSPHTPSSIDNISSNCCKSSSCKSSSCLSCRKAKSLSHQVPNTDAKDGRVKTCRKKLNVCQYTDANGAPTYSEKCLAQDLVKENCDRCTCCLDQTSSFASPKCNKNHSSPDQVCNKEGQVSKSPNHQNNDLCVTSANEDSCPQKVIPWYGAPASSLFQFYPHTYPYYIAYGINPTTVQDSSAEAPLDLSSSKRENSHGTAPDVQVDVPKSASDAVDRGMLYQLLKNKATK